MVDQDEVRFSPASELSLAALAGAFNAAFEGYYVPMRHTEDSLAAMLRTNDIRLTDSFVARASSGELVGVGLLGVRGTRGWIGGMAIVPEYRGRSNGARLMSALIDRSRGLGLTAIQLEVLDQNVAARRLYLRLGFVEQRPLAVYTGSCDLHLVPASTLPISEVPVAEALAHFAELHAIAPPWQREDASLAHMAPGLYGLALRDGHGPRSHLLWTSSGGGYALLDFGTRPSGGYAQQDALALIAHLTARDDRATLRAINVPPGDALGDALASLSCPVVASQREMHLSLG
jgi:ribosomal protein S18 acetylase RimI-like enzyme